MAEQKGTRGSLLQALILSVLLFFGFQLFFGHHHEKARERVSGTKTVVKSDIPPSKEVGTVVKVDTPLYDAEISTVNGKLVKLYVKKYKAQLVSPVSKSTGVYPLMTVADSKALSEELATLNLTPSALSVTVKGKPEKLILRGKLQDGREFVKTFIFYPDSYRIDVETSLKGAKLQTLVGPDIKVNEAHTSRMGHIGPVLETEDKVVRLKPKDIPGYLSFNRVLWAGEEDKYFLMAVKQKVFPAVVELLPGEHTVVRNLVDRFTFYGGPKELNRLEKLGLDQAIDFGIFGFAAKPTLKLFLFLHRFIPDWGLLIIVFTVLIRILLHPLAHKTFVSMRKMQELAPKLEEIKKKYGNDPQKLQEETMKLYKETGVNPASGCLPMLLQIPIFLVLYEIFLNAVELKGASFLWVPDLSRPDPTYLLPVLMGASMILQQFLTPTTNPQQRYIFIAVSVIFTFMFAHFPAGLVLYWFTNNVITALQNFIIKKVVEMKGA